MWPRVRRRWYPDSRGRECERHGFVEVELCGGGVRGECGDRGPGARDGRWEAGSATAGHTVVWRSTMYHTYLCMGYLDIDGPPLSHISIYLQTSTSDSTSGRDLCTSSHGQRWLPMSAGRFIGIRTARIISGCEELFAQCRYECGYLHEFPRENAWPLSGTENVPIRRPQTSTCPPSPAGHPRGERNAPELVAPSPVNNQTPRLQLFLPR